MTDNKVPPDETQYAPRSPFVRLISDMPGWKRKLLGTSLVVGLIGLGGEAVSAIRHHTDTSQTSVVAPTQSAPTVSSNKPPGSSGFVGGDYPAPNTPTSNTQTAPATTQPDQTVTEKSTPWMTRIGLSFFVGIVVGTIFRTFAKMAIGITALIAAAMAGLSYFHIFNVDFSSVQNEYQHGVSWLHDQAYRLKDVVFNALPSSTSAAVGFISGLKRK